MSRSPGQAMFDKLVGHRQHMEKEDVEQLKAENARLTKENERIKNNYEEWRGVAKGRLDEIEKLQAREQKAIAAQAVLVGHLDEALRHTCEDSVIVCADCGAEEDDDGDIAHEEGCCIFEFLAATQAHIERVKALEGLADLARNLPETMSNIKISASNPLKVSALFDMLIELNDAAKALTPASGKQEGTDDE